MVLDGSPEPRGRHVRPWWGLGDVILAVPVIVIVATIGSLVSVPFLSTDQSDAVFHGGATPAPVLALSLLFQQAAQGSWPFLVSKWKGLGPVLDWRLRFKPIDLLIGLGTACIAFGAAAASGSVVSHLVGLKDQADADNTKFLTDAKGTLWVYVFLFAAVIGAPMVEELFFRGLTMRALEKRLGPIAAVIGTTIVFTLAHFQGGSWQGTVVLFASIGAVGLVLATVTMSVGRLWPSVFAHMLFNALGAASALGALSMVKF